MEGKHDAAPDVWRLSHKKKKESTLPKKVNIYALLLIMDLAPWQ